MKLGVLSASLASKPVEEMLSYLSDLGVEAVELGTGGYTNDAHTKPEELLADKAKLAEYKKLFPKYNIEISALSVHGNAVSPDKDFAKLSHEKFETTCKLANELGVETVITFSGCPGGSPEDKMPNWVTCPWPEDFLKVLDYQWNDVLIPYWQKTSEIAKSYGINKIAFEMHPGFCVYNPETMLKIRAAVGDCLGANFDPSHLIWQGIDPTAAIKELGTKGAIFHFHAKDTKIDKYNTAVNGVLDCKHYGDELNRSWVFRSLGYGNDYSMWKEMVSMLQLVGYNHVMSIEHEDSYMTINEGLEKAVSFLRSVIISEPKPNGMFWA
ncbi:MAG: sugar phosphate isomerase/epimerase [Clostridia bacterium]|nr:sugar phosphate isomerase/epimerase [Clostridia bacterium]